MSVEIKFIIIGYLSGSVLFARICAKVLNKPEILRESKDGNPGTANAFQYGGFLCGVITLIGDLAKGFLPIYIFLKNGGSFTRSLIPAALVFSAPVIGHAFPLYWHFQGGKGIAVTFGCLLAALPEYRPLLIFALLFVVFSTLLKITPHYSRTIVTYIAAMLMLIFTRCIPGIKIGFLIISAIVIWRMNMSKERREKGRLRVLWM